MFDVRGVQCSRFCEFEGHVEWQILRRFPTRRSDLEQIIGRIGCTFFIPWEKVQRTSKSFVSGKLRRVISEKVKEEHHEMIEEVLRQIGPLIVYLQLEP